MPCMFVALPPISRLRLPLSSRSILQGKRYQFSLVDIRSHFHHHGVTTVESVRRQLGVNCFELLPTLVSNE
jgi:hypothetical protein